MPRWEDYKAHARERGALAHELYVSISTPCAEPDAVKECLPRHLAYQAELEAAGKLAFAGPLSDESGEQMNGTGMVVYRAESLESAREMAEADPMHQEGVRSFVLRRWLINEGSLTLSVRLSGQSVALGES